MHTNTNTNIFNVISESANTMVFKSKSQHLKYERNNRVATLKAVLGEGIGVASFIVDRGHAEGVERHIIHHNGVIVIVNDRTHKVVTTFACSPNYLTRYWRGVGKQVPVSLNYLLETARRNVRLGLTRLYQ
jgi:hypothetical protein